jgi:hypothetical protein
MPQMLTYSISAKVDKGPEIKSDAKLEAASYSAWVEETICRCQTGSIELNIGKVKDVGLIVIAADRYANEKDCAPVNGKAPCKYVRFKFGTEMEEGKPCPCPTDDTAKCAEAAKDAKLLWHDLPSAQVISDCYVDFVVPDDATRLHVHNPLSTDIKVSVLVTRKPARHSAATISA